ncbi:sensor histidine kinase [Alkalibacillus aidingensis]|uniref:sensor histidine kinase n=1 Tax=Alkalibacillus aidingensis TaxID=2747607 RepID=UPI001660ACC5|nr:sensor histidine kinase [Alkalibacillus aidingensis]
MIQMTNEQMMSFLMKMYKNSSEAIFFLDDQNQILALNPSAENIIDPSVLESIKGGGISSVCSFCRGYSSEEQEITCTECYLQEPSKDFSSFQVYLETKNRGIVPYAATYHSVDENDKVFVFMLRDLTTQYKTQESLYKNQLTKKTIQAQENERKRISRELHDSVVQELVSMLVDMRVLKYMDNKDSIVEQVKQSEESLNRLLEDVRDLSVFLRPASLDDLGLEAAFRTHFKWLENNYGVQVNMQSTLNQNRYSPDIETAVYRICQEAVLNATKYSGTDQIHVLLSENSEGLELIVRDHGKGFNVNSPEVIGTGLGLGGMEERAEIVGGNLKVYSVPNEGTTIYFKVPVVSRVEEEVHENNHS